MQTVPDETTDINSIAEPDYRALISLADFCYQHALPLGDDGVPLTADGLPIGNGWMGGLVCGTPDGLYMQINRPDVMGVNSYTGLTAGQMLAHGCGQVLIDLGGTPFAADDMRQGLAHYDAIGTLEGGNVRIRAIALHTLDVLALEVTDTRENPPPITVMLRMQREPVVTWGPRPFTGISEFQQRDAGIILTQTYHEPAQPEFPIGEHFCRSALAAHCVGRDGTACRMDERTMVLDIAPGQQTFLILVTSAATLDPAYDVIAHALEQRAAAAAAGFDALFADNIRWWHEFWSRSYLDLRSENGDAEFLARGWIAWLYQMACTSQGSLPPHWNSGLWYPYGDWMMAWNGPKYWGWNLMPYYRGLPMANHLELAQPFFNLYSGALENAKWHAEHLRGAKDGIFLSETSYWNGPRQYPDTVADELRRYLFNEIGYDDFSATAKSYAEAAQRACTDEGNACDPTAPRPYFYHTHCYSTGAKVAWRSWLAYEYNQDPTWLHDLAYPLIRGMAEFYRNYPNVRKEADGQYHIYNVHSHEPVWGAQDTMEELCAMRAMTALAVRASEILGVDEELRPLWYDIYQHTTPIPTTVEANVVALPHDESSPEGWAQARLPAAFKAMLESATPARQVVDYDLLTAETDDPEGWRLAAGSLELNPWYHDLCAGVATFCLSEIPTMVIMMGRAAQMQQFLPRQLSGEGWRDKVHIHTNNLMANDWLGRDSLTNEGHGYNADNLQHALLQSIAAEPGGDPVIRVFPAWPREWDARYKLAARHGFLITASQQQGSIAYVRIESQYGRTCRIRNPWPDAQVTLSRVGNTVETLQGSLLVFETGKGEQVLLSPNNS